MRKDVAEGLAFWTAGVAGVPPGAVVTAGKVNLSGFQRTRGSVLADQAGVLVINMYAFGDDTVPASTFTVPKDVDQPDFRYAWDVIVIHPYVEITFTNGGAASTIFRGQATALPQ